MNVIELMRILSEMNPTSEVCFNEQCDTDEIYGLQLLEVFEDGEEGYCVFILSK